MSDAPRDYTNQIWKNRNKAGDKHPDWRGTLEYEGRMIEVALWERTTKTGTAYFYAKASPARERQAQNQAPRRIDDSEIPF